MKKIIFVCTGNTCRSPMAEAMGKKYLKDTCQIISRGLSVSYPQGPNEKSVIAMDMEGIDIRDHIAHHFVPSEVDEDTVILGMTGSHTDYLKTFYPNLKDQVYTLLEYVGMSGEVADPFGQSQEIYNRCAKLIKKAILKIK